MFTSNELPAYKHLLRVSLHENKKIIWCIFQLKIQECGNKVVGAGVWRRGALVKKEENEDEGP